jgi:DNA-binding IclR family transcriptional regulator
MPASTSAAGTSSVLSTLTHAVRLLGEYSIEQPVLGTTELARRLKLSKSTTHRLVTTLATHGLLRRTDDGRYRLGLRLFEIASLIPASLELREVAMPHLKQLERYAQETVHLAVREGAEIVYLEKVESTLTIRMYSRIGRRAPLYCTGIGKAILAFEPEHVVQLVIEAGLQRFTPDTLVEEAALRQELARIREDGYALDREEIEVGLRCVASPIRDYSRKVVAGVSVAGPARRMTVARVRDLIPYVQDMAGRISGELGYRAS